MNLLAAVLPDAPATLAAVSQEQAAALGGFLAGVEKRAFRIAQIATRDRDEALDIVQDAMLQLARRYATRPPAEWTPLFYRILNNRIHDWQRREQVRRRVLFWRRDQPDDDDVPDFLESLPDRAAHGDELLARRQAMLALETALRALPARQREAFELRVWQGLSVEEAARAMGCSQGSVKTHLFRALQVLRKKLEDFAP